MPRKPIDYSKGLIYKIVCKDLNIKECYYGSTTDLRNRKYCHKTRCNNVKSKHYNLPVYQFIRVNGGWDNWDIMLVKDYPCNSKLELESEERRCMEEDHNRLNQRLPSHTRKEVYKCYRINNADKYKELNKQYYIDNINKIKQRKKTLITCECGCVITYGVYSKHQKSKKHKKLLNQF